MNPQYFEDAVGQLWSGRSLDWGGVGTMIGALIRADATHEELYFLKEYLVPGRQREELIPQALIYGSKEKQYCRALFLTLMALIAEEEA